MIASSGLMLKGRRAMAESGDPLGESEDLAYLFLKLANICDDLRMGLTRSSLNAKADQKKVEGLLYRELSGSAAEKSKVIQAEAKYVEATKIRNDLEDLASYLQMKHETLMANYYYYRSFNKG